MSVWDSLFALVFGRRGAKPGPTTRAEPPATTPAEPQPPPAEVQPAPADVQPAPEPPAPVEAEAPPIEAPPAPEPAPPIETQEPPVEPPSAETPAPSEPAPVEIVAPTPPPPPPLTAWRLAKSLERLRTQVNERFPTRSKLSDGTIGDARHAVKLEDSDHNPWIIDGDKRVVSAFDITNDPSNCSAEALVQALVASRDPRIKYIIFNRQMISSYPARGLPEWTWRPYSGANPHDKHCHISVITGKDGYDDERDWTI